MASKASSSIALLLSLNLLFFTMVTSHNVPCPPSPKSPKPQPQSPPPAKASCPVDTLKLGVCADLLGLVHVVVGTPPVTPCCTLLQGLANLEAAVCLCTAIKANILGINLNIPVDLSLLLNYCGKTVPTGFQCA
ncbi:14 kDa proline-rich protein DC2.15-like [Melia azedarach]|uniref:14 kDa proline-rich protein DC2.15-like n=1 Tax=Melia azedarach TaxID=155640 RepID=A0ACC1YX47_MELAZ|nr:14 kDa proline-rich protein DC2.15-like [Melia azedarach]